MSWVEDETKMEGGALVEAADNVQEENLWRSERSPGLGEAVTNGQEG